MTIFLIKIFNILLMLLVITCNLANASTSTRGTYGDKITWPAGTKNIPVYINPINNNQLNEAFVITHITNALEEWNGHSRITLTNAGITNAPSIAKNDIYFSNDQTYFSGSAVVAVTQISYRESTGEILDADIIINDSRNFSLDKSNFDSSLYLGDAIAHEAGHLLGLGHSEVQGSTMFYSLTKGQHTLSSEDKSGIYNKYPSSTPKGTISGNIIGGSKLTGILGAHIQAFSLNDGAVAGATISDSDGSFIIGGLNLNDTYFLYVGPSKVLEVLPSYYLTSKSNFCASGGNYRGSFFQSCNSQDEGIPQGITLTNNTPSKNAGSITVRCLLDVSPAYLSDKTLTETEYALVDSSGNAGHATTGYFSNTEISSGTATDTFTIDLSNFPVTSSDIYLDVNITTQSLFVPLRLIAEVYRGATRIWVHSTVTTDINTGSISIDITGHIPLEAGIVADAYKTNDNLLTLEISPDNSYTFDNNEFSDITNYGDDISFYLLTMSITQKSGSSYTTVSRKDYGTPSDNKLCPDAYNTYQINGLASTRPLSALSSGGNDDDNGGLPVSCGTIDTGGHGDGGPSSMALGFFLTLLFIRLSSKRKKTWFPGG